MNAAWFEEFRRRVGGRRAISGATFVALAPLAVISNVYRIDTSGSVSPAQRLGFAAFTFATATAAVLVAWWLFRLRRAGTVSPLWLVLGCYAAIGLLRSSLPTLGASIGLLPDQDVNAVSLIQGVVVCVVWFSLVAYVVDGFDQERRMIASLQIRTSELAHLRKSAAEQLHRSRRLVQSAISRQVMPTLDALLSTANRSALEGPKPEQLRALANDLRTTLQQSISLLGRRLTEQLHQQRVPDSGHADVADSPWEPTGVRGLVSVASTNPFSPIANGALIFTMFLGITIIQVGFLAGMLITVLIALVNFSACLLARGVHRTVRAQHRALSWFGLTLLIGMATGLPLAPTLAGSLHAPLPAVLFPVIIVQLWIGTLIACANSAREQLDRTRRALEVTKDSYVQETLGLEAATAAITRRTGVVLHGEIQGRLVANALRLDLAADSTNTQLQESALAAFTSDLQRVALDIEHVTDVQVQPGGLETNLTSLVTQWNGIVHIEFSDLEPALDSLSAEYCAVVTEIVREGINNAAKHGRATAVSVTIAVESDALRVVVVDNGVDLPRMRDDRLLIPKMPIDSVEATADLKREHQTTHLVVRIPVDSSIRGEDGPNERAGDTSPRR